MKHISILLLFFSALHLQAQQIDAKKSMVTFKIGNMGVMSVNGSIKGMHGDIKFNPINLQASSFDVSINPTSIDRSLIYTNTYCRKNIHGNTIKIFQPLNLANV